MPSLHRCADRSTLFADDRARQPKQTSADRVRAFRPQEGTNMTLRSRLFVAVAVSLFAVYAWAAELPRAQPEAVGLSSERLDRIGKVLRAKVDAGEIPGYVALVARHGKVAYYEAYGQQDPNTKAPMKRDSIFRIYSMTKPLTSV